MDLLILWRVFEHCNLRCRFCAYSTELQRSRITADVDQVLSFGALLKEYSRTRQLQIQVSWLGGEPLLWPRLPMISRTFHRECGLQLGITTNGVLLESRAIRDMLLEDFADVTISVDGVGAFHDYCRKAPGLYDRIRRDIKALAAEATTSGSALRLRLNTILMRGNVDRFEDLCREIVEWGVKELTFNQLGGNDRPEFYPENRPLEQQVERFAEELPRIQTEMSLRGLTIRGGRRYLDRLIHTARNARLTIDDCQPGKSFLFIDEQGRIAPCSFTPSYYGMNIKDIASLTDLNTLPEIFSWRRQELALPCHDCHSTQAFDKFTTGNSRLSRSLPIVSA